MNMNVLAYVAGMILFYFIIKDTTVKQVTLNVTDTDKINIVSSQAVLEMPSFSVDTHSISFSPLVNNRDVRNIFFLFWFGFGSVFRTKITWIWFGMSLVRFSPENAVRFRYYGYLLLM